MRATPLLAARRDAYELHILPLSFSVSFPFSHFSLPLAFAEHGHIGLPLAVADIPFSRITITLAVEVEVRVDVHFSHVPFPVPLAVHGQALVLLL